MADDTEARGVNPRRITWALDLRELYGPQVDRDCGVEEPAVDRWEDPDDPLLPDEHQLALLAALTRFPVAWFYGPDPPQLDGGWVCFRRKVNGRKCHPVAEIAADAERERRRPAQLGLFGEPERVDPPPTPRRKQNSSTPAAATSSRMPEHLRAKLQNRIDEAKGRG